MTRDEIIDKICPSDAITDCCSGECLFGCDDCSLTLGFILDEYDKQIRAEAIDEFMVKINDRLCEESFTKEVLDVNKVPIQCELLTLDGAVEIVCEVFEQLKEQK